MTRLFDEKERVDIDPSRHNENTYEYYDRSARADVTKVRVLLNEWFANYPVDEQLELKSRFRKTFSSAYFELFIHELFRKQGFEIQIHPQIRDSKKRPDFLMRRNGSEFYLEAKEARDKSTEQEAFDNRSKQAYDSLNKIKSPNFLLYVDDLHFKSDKQPSLKMAIAKIEAEASKHDPDVISEQFKNGRLSDGVPIAYEDDNFRLLVYLIPKIPSARSSATGQAIGAYPIETIWGGQENSIKDSFEKKSSRYGSLDKPYFICINAIGIVGHGDFDVNSALWGSLAVTWSEDPKNQDERQERMRDGMFLGKKGPRGVNVTGVFVTKVMEFNIHIVPHWFAKHPFSKNVFDFDIFDLTHQFVHDGQIHTSQKKTIAEILDIDPQWLGN